MEILRRLDPIPHDLAENAALFLQKTPRDRSQRLVRNAERLGRLLPRFSGKGQPTHCYNGEPTDVMFRKVLERFEEAIQEDPTNPNAYLERGVILYFQKREDEAREDIRRALALGVEDPEKYILLAMPLRGDEARAALQLGMARCEDYPWDDPADGQVLELQLRFNYGHTYWRERDFNGCAEYFRAHLNWLEGLAPLVLVNEGHAHDFQASNIHNCCGFLSMCYEFLGDTVEAERAVRRSLPYLDRLPWKSDEPQRRAADIIRLRCEAGDFAGAIAACDEFQAVLIADEREPWETLLVALGEASATSRPEPGAEDRQKQCESLLRAVKRARLGHN